MGHSNGKITAPINLAGDVYATLGIGPTSDGYELGYACANTHGKINPWHGTNLYVTKALHLDQMKNGGKDGMGTVVSNLFKWQDTGMRQNTQMEV